MTYVERQYNEIFEEMLNDSVEKGLISHAEEFLTNIKNQEDISNYYVLDKSVIAAKFAEIYKQITQVYESSKVEYAESTDLDDIGLLIGVPRPTATSAIVELVFTSLSTVDGDITLPEGIVVSTDSGIEYRTLEPLYFSSTVLESRVTAIANVAGVNGKVNPNTLTNIITNLEYNLTCTNESGSSGGSEAYTDDEYRYLLMNWIKIRLKGSLEAYENYFANFEGIDSYKIIPNWDGAGTMKIILDPGTPYQLNQAYNELQNSITQATEDIVLSSPAEKMIDVYASVNVDIDQINPYSSGEKEEIRSRIITATRCFIDGGYRVDGSWYPGLILGEDFIPHKLAVFLDDEIQELKNIDFTYPSAPISILDDEIGVSNNINIEMI